MAIKGKSRSRGGPRGAVRAPVRAPDPTPAALLQRGSLRRAVVVVLSIATVIGGARVWQNTSRADQLRRYLPRLYAAQASVQKLLAPGSKDDISAVVKRFSSAQTTVKTFLRLATTWETDFRTAKAEVEALRPPAAAKSAQELIVSALDLYTGVARLYNLAAQDRQVGDRQGGKAQAAFEDKVQVTLLQSQEIQDRAAALYSLGGRRIESLRREWLGFPAGPSITGVPDGLFTEPPSPEPSPTQ